MATSSTARPSSTLAKVKSLSVGYSREKLPINEYASVLGVFGLAFAGMLLVANQKDSKADKLTPLDLALIGIATHKLTRIVAKDIVTTPFRAPFTKRVEDGDVPGEVEDESRGVGARKVVGQLVGCPWCLAPWISSALSFGLLVAPKATRFATGIFCSVAVSDWLNSAFDKLNAPK